MISNERNKDIVKTFANCLMVFFIMCIIVIIKLLQLFDFLVNAIFLHLIYGFVAFIVLIIKLIVKISWPCNFLNSINAKLFSYQHMHN